MAQSGLPKSLWKFYIKYAVRGHVALLAAWALTQVWVNSGTVWLPMMQRWFVALFEQPATGVSNFIAYALPTVIMLLLLEMSFTTAMVLRDVFSARWRPIIRNQISEELTDYVQRQSMSFWAGRMAGKINSQINYVAEGFLLIIDFVRVAALLGMMALNVVLILQVNSYVAVIFGLVFAFRLVYGISMMGPMHRASKQASESSSTLSGKLVDSLANFSIVKLFAGASQEKKYLRIARRQQILDSIHSSFVQRLFYAVPGYVWDMSYGVTLFLCVWLFARGGISISEIVFTMSVYFHVMMAISAVIDVIPNIVDKYGSAKKSYDELVVPIEVTDALNAPALHVTHGKIEFKNVWFRYRAGRRWILRDFSLTINPGESVGLVGSSGAGKTTLVNLLMRFYDPTRGQILIDGQDIRNVSQDSLRSNIAFIPQEPTMFNRTIAENIGYGRSDANLTQIRAAARRAAADGFIMAAEKQYDTLVGDSGIKMSGGQRQRVAIAR
ncbi:MAG: ABC transporter ATP-binding protein/permease, partial [Alphaproteobacteria bacterium]|nr:ABC transporter ATP-binding protein/permease [Alphaproteobacteria bacterium]